MSINYKCGNDKMKDFPDTSKNNMEGQKLLKVECGRYNQEKENSPNATQTFSGCVKLCCMPQRFTSYTLHSKKKIHRLVRSCTLSTEKSQVSSQQCCCFCWLVGWSVLWLSRIMEGNSRHHFQTPTYLSNQKSKKNTQWQWKICKTKAHYLQAFD